MAENQELLAVLERRFTDLAESIDESRAEARERFDRLEGETRNTAEGLGRFEGETRERFDRLEGEVRHAHVRIESLGDAVRLVAESVAGVDEKLERFRTGVDHQFDEVRSLIRLSYGQLEQRISTLEGG